MACSTPVSINRYADDKHTVKVFHTDLLDATNFGARRLDAAFLDATWRVLPEGRHVCAVPVERLRLLIGCIVNAGWYQPRK